MCPKNGSQFKLLAQWEKIDKNRMYNIFKSMTHVVPSHLLDRSLWDFHEFHALTQPPKPLKPRRQSKN